MPGPPAEVEAEIAIVQAAQAEAAAAVVAAEAAAAALLETNRQSFNQTNQWMEDNYLLSLMKNISWRMNNIFTSADESSIKSAVLISDDEAKLLTTTGATADTADERNMGLWMSLNSDVTGKDGQTLEHYFDNIYQKLACCTGQSSVTVPILKRNATTGAIEKVYKKITVDRTSQCTMNNVDWADDNTTEASYKPHCEDFMQRLIAVLSKYDPDNPILEIEGGCLANKNLDAIDEDILKDPFLVNLVNVNRSCLMPTCNNPSAYKRKEDRKTCETSICTAEISVSDSQAGGAISVFGNEINQQCGASSELSSALAGGEEIAEEIIATKEAEIEAEIEAATKELELVEAEQEAQSTEAAATEFYSGIFTFFSTFFSSLFGSITGTTEGFQNFNFGKKIFNFNYLKYLFLSLIFLIIPLFLFDYIKK